MGNAKPIAITVKIRNNFITKPVLKILKIDKIMQVEPVNLIFAKKKWRNINLRQNALKVLFYK